jgi:uncharacterized protein YggU (UPF0235/DUF167 family)
MFYKLKVHPDSKQDRLVRKGPDAFEIWVKAPAKRGMANASAMRLLAGSLKTEAKRILLVKGAKSPAKIVKTI